MLEVLKIAVAMTSSVNTKTIGTLYFIFWLSSLSSQNAYLAYSQQKHEYTD